VSESEGYSSDTEYGKTRKSTKKANNISVPTFSSNFPILVNDLTQKTTSNKTSAIPAKAKPKKTFTSTQLKQRLLAVPHSDLVATVVNLVSRNELDEDSLINALPVPSCDVYVATLQKSANAISRALPHSRFGSSSDHYGFKRCSSAVTAFKKQWNEIVTVLSGGDRAVFFNYVVKALEVLHGAVDFDVAQDNTYKTLCLKKVNPPVKKFGKEKNLTQQEQADYTKISKSLEVLETPEKK